MNLSTEVRNPRTASNRRYADETASVVRKYFILAHSLNGSQLRPVGLATVSAIAK